MVSPFPVCTIVGKEHVIFFTDPECSLFDEVYDKLEQAAADGLPVLMVAQHGLEEMRAKAAARGFTFPVAYDSMNTLSDPMRVTGFPMAAWVDAEGILVRAAAGNTTSAAIIDMALKSVLADSPGGK